MITLTNRLAEAQVAELQKRRVEPEQIMPPQGGKRIKTATHQPTTAELTAHMQRVEQEHRKRINNALGGGCCGH
jgi:hypothetical protein